MKERSEAGDWSKKVGIIAKDEFTQCGWSHAMSCTSVNSIINMHHLKLGRLWIVNVQRFNSTHLTLNLSHRALTGASTLTSRKNGRLRSVSTTASSHMSVVTQRSRHRNVTKCNRDSASGNVRSSSSELASGVGTWGCEANLSTVGVKVVRMR